MVKKEAANERELTRIFVTTNAVIPPSSREQALHRQESIYSSVDAAFAGMTTQKCKLSGVYFVRIQDLNEPIPEPENEGHVFIVAHK